jgi:hypothetical protein
MWSSSTAVRVSANILDMVNGVQRWRDRGGEVSVEVRGAAV